jgi:serine/threonine protein kinase
MSQNLNTVCCLNPACTNPVNSINTQRCQNCGTPIAILENRYHPIKLLSDEGGFGRTYLAIDLKKLNRECVIKQLAPQVQGTGALKKATELFEQEAQQLEKLGEHPQIPALLAYFEENGYLYLIQQYIKGKTLDKLPNQGVWNEQEVKDFLLNILPVLTLIHGKNIIHRDIKPNNIIKRDDNGNYVLIDFGASKELEGTIATKATTIGTYGYSAREQIIEGKAYPGSDLFSLGVTCFYLLTKVEPGVLYVDEGYRWLDNWDLHLKQPLSKEFKEVLKQLLEKDMKSRFSSAHQVLKALQTPSAKEETKQNKSTATPAHSVTPKPTVLSQQQVKTPPPPKAKVIPQSEKKISNPQKLNKTKNINKKNKAIKLIIQGSAIQFLFSIILGLLLNAKIISEESTTANLLNIFIFETTAKVVFFVIWFIFYNQKFNFPYLSIIKYREINEPFLIMYSILVVISGIFLVKFIRDNFPKENDTIPYLRNKNKLFN